MIKTIFRAQLSHIVDYSVKSTIGRVPLFAFSSSFHKMLHNKQCPQRKVFTVAVEGNIGSGKTELINLFSDSVNVKAFTEPVEKWCNVDGHNALDTMYKDPGRWCFAFQTYVQMTMVEQHLAPTEAPVKLMERSVYSSRYCFAENMHKSGVMADMDYVILDKWFKFLIESHSCHVDLIVYLQTRPEVAFERLKTRGRKEEDTVPLDYLRSLHELHETWLLGRSQFTLPAPVLVIDANLELSELKQVYEDKREQILCGVA